MITDLRFAWRALAKNRAFALTAVTTLALGIGANTAIFSVINQVLLNPAGVANPDRVVAVRARYDKLALRSIPVSVPDFADVENSRTVFDSAAILQDADLNYTGGDVPEHLQGAMVSYAWFDVFRAKPQLGRLFSREEDQPGANQVTILSDAAWTRLFARDAGVIGRSLELNQLPYRIVGVMGPEFRWPARVDLWVPQGLARDAYSPSNRFNESLTCLARLQSGVTFARATSFMRVLNDRVYRDGTRAGAYAQASGWAMFVVPFTDFVAGDTRTPLLVLLGAVGFVLLIACSNIAGLMLTRASGRAGETAIRAALGAGRVALIRQIVSESLLLAGAGAAVGLAVAGAGARALLRLAPDNATVALKVRLDARVVVVALLAAAVSAVLFSLAPACQVLRLARFHGLGEGGRRSVSSMRRQRFGSGLVVGEVSLALVLLVGAGLFLRSLARLHNIRPGFDPGRVMSGLLSLPQAQYATPEKRLAFYTALIDRLSHLPGAVSAAVAMPVPFTTENSASFAIEGRPQLAGDPGPHGDLRFISPDYDRTGGEPVAIIDDYLAQQYWPNENPLGKRLRLGPAWSTIVGIVGHVKHSSLAVDSGKGAYYIPLFQQPLPAGYLLVRADGDPSPLAGAMRDRVQSLDPQQPVHDLVTMESRVAASLEARRFVVTVLGFFAAMALLMATLGLYGVISYAVSQRTNEIGVRMALGAHRQQVLRLVVGQGMRLALAGGLLGLAASILFSRWLASQLFTVSPFDPLTFVAVAAVLILAALLASYIPAARAARLDPGNALRYE